MVIIFYDSSKTEVGESPKPYKNVEQSKIKAWFPDICLFSGTI